MRDYVIIIPSRTEDNLRTCLSALHYSERIRVMVYDNDESGGVEKVCASYGVTRVIGVGSPFVFSKAINTCMILCPDKDVIVMNDDAVLRTLSGLDSLHNEAVTHLEYGIVSAAVSGFVGNLEQCYKQPPYSTTIRTATQHTIVFICVHILRALIDKVGPLEERLIHYGWEDNLYCLQARAIGYKLGIFDGCVVEHGSLPSTYRTRPHALDDNRRIFESIVREKGLTPYWPVPFKFQV